MIKLEGETLELITKVIFDIYDDKEKAVWWLNFYKEEGMEERALGVYKDYHDTYLRGRKKWIDYK